MTKVLHTQASAVTLMRDREIQGYAALSPNIRVDCREHLMAPTDNLRSEQDVHVVAGNVGNASSNAKLMSTIGALSYSTLVANNFLLESTI